MGEDTFKNDIVYDLLKSSMDNSKEASIMACQQTKAISQIISTMLLLLNSMGKGVETKKKKNSGRGRRNNSYNRGGFIQKSNYSNQNSGNHKQLSPNSPNFSNPNPSFQILHAQSAKFSIN